MSEILKSITILSDLWNCNCIILCGKHYNEWFAKDTSRKVKTSLNAKFRAGERTFAYAPIGYKRHPDTKNKLVVDEETRWIVEKIYELALLGNGSAKVTKILIAAKSK